MKTRLLLLLVSIGYLCCPGLYCQSIEKDAPDTIRIRKQSDRCRVSFAGISKGEISYDELRNSEGLKMSCQGCTVLSYSITSVTGNGLNVTRSITGYGIPRYLNPGPGQRIYIENIWYRAKDGTVKRTNAIELKIIK
ncbi:MAG TPA: hypothetical protein VNZ86_18110 [Bacteroidia bacterium]|jgi:hypothetical protein|nr:hypothetical protein [Bacteroidia bacterium]